MLRNIMGSAVLAAAFLTGGCTIVALERNNFGGAIDAAEDRWFAANDRSTRILRNHFIHAGLVRMGSRSQYSANQRNVMANMSNNVTDRTVEMLNCFAMDCIHFESLMITYEDSLFMLALHVADSNERSALIDNWQKLPKQLASGSPASLATGATVIWATAQEAVATARPLGALYRDGIVVQALDRNGKTSAADTQNTTAQPAAAVTREGLACVKDKLGKTSDFDRNYYAPQPCGAPATDGKKRSELFADITLMLIAFCGNLGASDNDKMICAGMEDVKAAMALQKNRTIDSALQNDRDLVSENKVIVTLDANDGEIAKMVDHEQVVQ